MNKLKRVRLVNIELYKDETFYFDRKSTAIVGQTDSCKSGIFRIIWSAIAKADMNIRFDEIDGFVEFEDWDGNILSRYHEDTVSYKCEKCDLKSTSKMIECDCGSKEIAIVRKQKEDIYSIDGLSYEEYHEGKRDENCDYEKMGRGFKNLAKDIKDRIPFASMDLGEELPFYPGFRGQFAQFIWDELKPSNFNRIFSYIEGHDYVQDMMKLVKAEIKEDKALVKLLKSEVKDKKDKLTISLESAEAHKAIFEQEKLKRDKISESWASYSELEDLYLTLIKYSSDIKEIKSSIEELKVIDVDKLEKLTELFKLLREYKSTFRVLRGNISQLEAQIKDIKVIPIDTIEKKVKELQELRELRDNLKTAKFTVAEKSSLVKDTDEDIEATRELIMKNTISKNLCPWTGWKLNENCKKRILEEIDEDS